MTTHSHLVPEIRLFACTLAIVLCSLATDLTAQQFIGGAVAADTDRQRYDHYMQQLDLRKSGSERRIAMRLTDIDLAVELTEQQKKKLKIAAKGAVTSYMKTVTYQITKAAQQGGFDFEPGSPPEKEKQNDDGANVILARNFIRIGPNFNDELGVEQVKIWKSSLNNTLSKEQLNRLKHWETKRSDFLQQTAVNNFIAKVDLRLLLSPEQREKLKTWIDEEYGPVLANNFETSQSQLNQFILIQARNAATANKTPAAVATILNATQLTTWQSSFQGELEQIKGRNLNAAGGIFRFAPKIQINDDVD